MISFRRLKEQALSWAPNRIEGLEEGQFVAGTNNVPDSPAMISKSTFMEDFRRIVSGNVRTKPSYADCWLVGSIGELEKIAEYDTPSGHVVIGTAEDGEVEYNLTPAEYVASDAVNGIIIEAIDAVRKEFRKNGGRADRYAVDSVSKEVIGAHADNILIACNGNAPAMEQQMCQMADIVYRYTVGLGVFDILLADPKLEDIYVDAPCDKNRIHVTMSGVDGTNSHLRCRTNLVVDRREVMNLINVLKRDSGLPYCESSPVLETDMRQYDARATVVGFPMSPLGDAVAIRKHSANPWTMTRLIANGTISHLDAGLISYLVQNRATFLVCGARGAGKSSLLSAMMFEFPVSQRILTIEDTLELPGERLRCMGYKVQSLLVDDRMDGDSLSRSNEALRVSLRLGESAIILGEVRGEEARTLYQSMRTGRAGSSIMGTIHGDSAKTVFERVVHDMGISPEAFMATDVLVTVGTFSDRKTGAQTRRVSEVVATTDRAGQFVDISHNRLDFTVPVMRRAMLSSSMNEDEVREEIRARSILREFLAHVGSVHDGRFLGPEWVAAANEHYARNRGRSADDILNSFKNRFRDETGLDPEA
ncbi:Type IV secretory pathway, VirB11 components,-related ATPase involved in archaeal flagella biosynthesis [Thermoplasmatales archaeon BRNA1]|nr:Type IV secretory pathway, VirB11 components,-related ATPase involved in archaeal flagella biosynthesis [Thermoplasmatales archaeon BRNA1]